MVVEKIQIYILHSEDKRNSKFCLLEQVYFYIAELATLISKILRLYEDCIGSQFRM